MKERNKRVLVGMSGGIDSTATCLMLQEQGYEIVGVTMRVWGDEPQDARELAARMGIEHYVADVIHLLRYLYLELFKAYQKEATLMTDRKDIRKEELANKFFGLIMKHFKENKDVAFYADKLCITSKYLTMVIKETSGKSAKDWIVEYVILEIKTLLKNTNMNIQEIAIRTNFANQSSLGRFFRKHTGMSLSQYRMSHLG